MTPDTAISREDASGARRAAIEQAVKRAAWEHLRAPDAETALGYYDADAVVVCDGRWYESFEAFAEDAREFYRTLRDVHVAAWDRVHVEVLADGAAVFTATVRWESTDTSGVRTELAGVWTAIWVRTASGWRITARHESFTPASGGLDAAV